MTSLPSVSVIVPVLNGERTLGDCLASLVRLGYPEERRELLIVDNGSTDRTAEIIAGYPVRHLREEERGRSQARNRGIRESSGEILAFTDADCVVTTGWLRELTRGFEDDAVAGVAGEILAYPPATPTQRYLEARHREWQKDALRLSRPFAGTPNVAFRREVFDRIGLFDPALPRAQDKDLGWRFFGAGLKLHYNPRAVVLLRHPPTSWDLLKQHAGWGYGAALLHSKHGLPWGLRQELGKYAELVAAVGELARAGTRRAMKGGDEIDLHFHYLEVVRRVGLRVGALRGMLATAGGRGPFGR